ncbi:MAG: transcriptional regulator [Acidocella sp. 20-61-6]|nr:MAG: transcriptional regulator [Acidocella sp. 20-61-6]
MSALYLSREIANAATEKLKIYAQPQRLMILSYLLHGEHTVSEIDEATRIGQPALSQQLAALRRAALVETRRAAKQIFYRLADPSVIACVRNIEAMFAEPGGPVPSLEPSPAAAPVLPRSAPANAVPAGAAAFAKVF